MGLADSSRASLTALDRQRRHRVCTIALALPAGEYRADVPDHLEAAGDVVENLDDVLADLAHSAISRKFTVRLHRSRLAGGMSRRRPGRCNSARERRRATPHRAPPPLLLSSSPLPLHLFHPQL